MQLLRPDGERLVPIETTAGQSVVVVEVSGDMHYAATQSFMRDARALIPSRVDHVILDLSPRPGPCASPPCCASKSWPSA